MSSFPTFQISMKESFLVHLVEVFMPTTVNFIDCKVFSQCSSVRLQVEIEISAQGLEGHMLSSREKGRSVDEELVNM